MLLVQGDMEEGTMDFFKMSISYFSLQHLRHYVYIIYKIVKYLKIVNI